MKRYLHFFAFSAISLLSVVAQAAEPKCVAMEAGRVFFLASEVNPDFGCAKRGDVDYFVNKVITVDGDTIRVKNLENGVIWDAKKGLCGAATQDEAQEVTKRLVAECKSKQKR
ncbi:MAG: hypothetical protein M9929_00860 [Burkholderiaceae bacterium]|nr:hypothetical protein [Burkholderiaceae bacterium]